MSDVSLNAGIRANLLQLQESSSLFQRTTERLASGKKVNSAIDNPTNFFASVNLSDRAEGLSARLDGIGQAIQTVKSADNGISTIRSFVSAAKGVVNSAIGNSDADEREALGRQFNELLVQIASTAKDSGYQGVNLLQGNETNSVQFNENFDESKLDILGFDIGGPGADGLAEVDADGNVASAAQTAVVNVASIASAASTASAASVASAAAVTATTVSSASAASVASQAEISQSTVSSAAVASATETGFTASDNSVSATLSVGATGFSVTGNSNASTQTFGTASAASASATQATQASSAPQASQASATGTQATQASAASQDSVASAAGVSSAAAGTETAAVALFLADQTGGSAIGIQGAGSNTGSVDFGGENYQNDLAAVVQQLEAFDSELKVQAGALSQNLATITIREEFSNDLINTLNEGADKLTLADLNEEGANLLALQTSTQLATQSLSLASQQSQGVLQLLG